MNIDKLTKGMEFKNYKALCEFLGVKQKTGEAKQIQMAELGRHAEFHKVGNKIVIDEVLKVPQIKIDKRKDVMKKSNNATYSNDIQALLISLLAGADGHTVYLPTNRLLNILKMVNDNYIEAKRNIPKLAELTLVPESYCYEFFNKNNSELKGKLDTALRGLRRRGLVSYQECTQICVLEADIELTALGDIKVNPLNKKQSSLQYKRVHREATEAEIKMILHAEFQTLQEMNCESTQVVFLSQRWNEYQKKVSKKIAEANIEYYYDAYRLIYNLSDVTQVYLKQLDNSEREVIQGQLNTKICSMINKRANTMNKRAKKNKNSNKTDILQASDIYIEHMKTLNNVVINKDAKDIRKELRKPVAKTEQVSFEDMPF